MDAFEKTYTSRDYAWSSGGKPTIDLEFLRAATSMDAPVIREAYLECDYQVDVGSAGAWQQRLSEMFAQVVLKDGAGERVNLAGTSLFFVQQVERGIGYSDGPSLLAISTNNQTGTVHYELPFYPLKSRRRADYGIPLAEFLNGGGLQIVWFSGTTLGTTNEITGVDSITMRLHVVVAEERRREAKSRMCWIERNAELQDGTYEVNGSLRGLFYFAGTVGVNTAQTFASSLTVISRHLEYNSLQTGLLRKRYLLESNPRTPAPFRWLPASSGATLTIQQEDLVAAQYAIPLWWPKKDQKISEMPNIAGGVQLKFSTAPVTANQPRIIICCITDRSAKMMQRTFGFASERGLFQAVTDRGHVKTSSMGTDEAPLMTWLPEVAARLPLRIYPARKG